MDDFEYNYNSDDSGMEITRVSSDEQAYYDSISGIEGSYSDDWDVPEDEEPVIFSNLDPNERSTPENPLYDAQGNRIPFGFTRKDWDIRKKAIEEKQKQIKRRIEEERARFLREQSEISLFENETPISENLGSVSAGYTPESPDYEEVATRDIAERELIERINEVPMPEEAETVIQEPKERADYLGGHGEDNFTEYDLRSQLIQEPVPELWQEDFNYTVENGEIKLESYKGDRSSSVYIPSVAYDSQGREYKVRFAEDFTIGETARSVKVSNEIPEETFENLYRSQQRYEAETYRKAELEEAAYKREVTETAKPDSPTSRHEETNQFNPHSAQSYPQNEPNNAPPNTTYGTSTAYEETPVYDTAYNEQYENRKATEDVKAAQTAQAQSETTHSVHKETGPAFQHVNGVITEESVKDMIHRNIADGASASFKDISESFDNGSSIASLDTTGNGIHTRIDEYGEKSLENPKNHAVNGGTAFSTNGAVAVSGSIPIAGDAKGSYGNNLNAMATMAGNAGAIADITNSDFGLTDGIKNYTALDSEIAVKSFNDAREELYKAEISKNEQAGIRADINTDIERITKALKENATEIVAREEETKAKQKILNTDNIESTVNEGIMTTARAVGSASGINTTDGGSTIAKAKGYKRDFEYIFGDLKWRAAAALEQYNSAMVANAAEKYAAIESKLDEKDFQFAVLKGLKGKEKQEAIKHNINKKMALEEKLKNFGLSEKERTLMLKKDILERMQAGYTARNEILKLNRKRPDIFTKPQLDLVKSGNFFNHAGKADEISKIMHTYFANSDSALLAGLSPQFIKSMTFARKVSNGEIYLTLSDKQKLMALYQKSLVTGSYFTKTAKRKPKGTMNPLKITGHFLMKLDTDATVGLRKYMAYYRTTKNLASLAYKGLSIFVNKSGISESIQRRMAEIKKLQEIQSAQKAAAFEKGTMKGAEKAAYKASQGVKKAQKAAGDAKKTAKKVINAPKRVKQAAKKAVWEAIKDTKLGTMIASISAGLGKVAAVLASIGYILLIVIAVILAVYLAIWLWSVMFTNLGKIFLKIENSAITADEDDIVAWVERYKDKDEDKYRDVLKRAEEGPEGAAWDGSKIYHYGHYEDKYGHTSPNYNSKVKKDTPCYYHDPGVALRSTQISDNGIHVYYLDKNGQMIGANSSNVKDILTLTTVFMQNFSLANIKDDGIPNKEFQKISDKLYEILNPETVYIESELYACADGCDTYPKREDYLQNIKWAYECNNPDIYSRFNELKNLGVKFYPNQTFTLSTYSDKEYYERLVPQTTHGCNVNAKLDPDNVIEPIEYWMDDEGNYYRDEEGYRIIKHGKILGVLYEYFCGGYTINYERDYEAEFGDTGAYINNGSRAYGKSSTYANRETIDARESWEREGFNTYRMYNKLSKSEGTPHAAIKCCYGHRDLNVYITVLNKDDVIAASGNSIKYRIPKKVDKNGKIIEWENKQTESINDYMKNDPSLFKFVKKFYEDGDFGYEGHLEMIENIYAEDWFELYGANCYSDAALPDSLSRTGKSRLREEALKDIDTLRKNFVKKAYSYVGKIPYYWGGKASSLDYSSNKFGSTVPPDSMGRRKKGLDCSGFVHFVYCQVTNSDLKEVGSSTKSFCSSLGLKKIDYGKIKPGDIGLVNLPGSTSNHIGIYAGEGMWIHCSGSPTDTVVYKNTNMFRYYYSLE